MGQENKWAWNQFGKLCTCQDLDDYLINREYRHGHYFHYTKLNVADSILQNRKFWLSNVSGFNDTKDTEQFMSKTSETVEELVPYFSLCFSTAHIDDDSFCRYVIQQDISKIALDLREAHKDDFFSVPEDNPLEDFLQTAEETAREDSDPEQAAMMFICKRLKLNYKKLSAEEKKWLKRIAQKSDLLKNPTSQRGRK